MSAFSWAILTSIIWGIAPLFEKSGLSKDATPFAGLFFRCAGVVLGLIMIGIYVFKTNEIRSVDLRSAILIMAGGFLASFVAQICFYHALKSGEMSRIVLISGSYPLFTFILGIIILKEPLTLAKVIGALLIMAGLWALRIS